MGKAEDRLAEELEKAEARILENQIENEHADNRWRWARHKDLSKTQKLPVPRLEIFLASDDGYNREWLYRLVHRHFLGHCVSVPMGNTTQSGGCSDLETSDLLHFLPFRDGAHIQHDAKQFNMPAFIVAGKRVQEIPLEGKL